MKQKKQTNILQQVKEKAKTYIPAFANKVAPLYVLLQWAWWKAGVPKVEDIIIHLEERLDEKCLSKVGDSVSSGGLRVKVGESDGIPDISFSFIVEDVVYGGDVLREDKDD